MTDHRFIVKHSVQKPHSRFDTGDDGFLNRCTIKYDLFYLYAIFYIMVIQFKQQLLYRLNCIRSTV